MSVSCLGDPGEHLSFLFLDGLMGVGLTSVPSASFHIDLDSKCLLLTVQRGLCLSFIAGVDTTEPHTPGSKCLGGEDEVDKTIFGHILMSRQKGRETNDSSWALFRCKFIS